MARITGKEAEGLMQAYADVYARDNIAEENIQENPEQLDEFIGSAVRGVARGLSGGGGAGAGAGAAGAGAGAAGGAGGYASALAVTTSNVAKYRVGQRVDGISDSCDGVIVEIIPDTPGAVEGPGTLRIDEMATAQLVPSERFNEVIFCWPGHELW